MKVKEMIKKLQEYVDKYGEDLEIVHSADEEGNAYSTIEPGSLALVLDNPEGRNNHPVGVCIYPWEEGFEYAEQACLASSECGNHSYCNNGEGCDTCVVHGYEPGSKRIYIKE